MNRQFSRMAIAFVLTLITLMLMGCTAPPDATLLATAVQPTGTKTEAASAQPAAQASEQTADTPTSSASSPTSTPSPAATIVPTVMASPTSGATQESVAALATTLTAEAIAVAFVEEGEIKLWDEATNESETIFSEGDVGTVMMSDDGQVIAFIRSWVDVDGCNQLALWAVAPNGENPRELVSPAELRQQFGLGDTWEPPGCAFTIFDFFQIEWLPQTHRLLYSLFVGDEHTRPAGVYLVDTDTRAMAVLASAENSLHFVPSPDGRQVALLSTTGLSFINADGSDWREDVLTYPATGVPIPNFPSGVWSRDALHFLLVGPIASESEFVLNYTIWRVPVDGSVVQPLATIADSHSNALSFSPDGERAAFRGGFSVGPGSWSIIPLAAGVGPLAVPYTIETSSYTNLHWSPAGSAFVFPDSAPGTLFQLCPDATQAAEICGDPIHLGESVTAIRWIDNTRFVFWTHEPYMVSLGKLDGMTIPITAVSAACIKDSEFVLDVNVPDGAHFAPGTPFTKTWRVRNSGTCTWNGYYQLNFVSGERMDGPERMPLGQIVYPGGEADISIELIAPQADGTYEGQWQLTTADGIPFGAKPYVEIVVP